MGLRLFHGGKSNSRRSLATRKTSAGVLFRPHSLSPIKDKIKGENEFDSAPNSASPSTLVVSTFWLCLSVYYIVLRCQAVFEEFFS